MKKVLCLIDGLGFGGAQRQIIGLVSLLRQKGIEADLACYHERHFYDDLLNTSGIKPITLNPKGKFAKLKLIRNLIKDKQYEVVITYLQGPNSIGCLLKLSGLKFKLIVSDRITYQKTNKSISLRSHLYKFADYIVPNSFSQKDFLSNNFPFLKRKIITITNFTDTTKFVPTQFSRNNPPKILVVGRISDQKNITNLILALEILKSRDINLNIDWIGDVGRGMDKYHDSVMRMYEKSNIQDMLIFHPGVKDIVHYYQRCDAFCLPSLYEGFPNVICEAMSCGRPILCSDVCDNSYLVEDGINGFLFNPNVPESIADALESFSKLSCNTLQDMGNISREKALQICSMESFVNKYISLIND